MTKPGAARRIGLFGGSFDPPHNAHMALARAAVRQLDLDELRWVPVGQPWQKTRQLAAAEHRSAMVQLAVQADAKFVFEPCELQRTGPSYTLETVRALKAGVPGAQWFVLIGQDQFAGLHTWRAWRELLLEATLVVANRPGLPGASHTAAHAEPHADVLAALAQAPPQALALPPMAVSSTTIRARLAQGQRIEHLVPPDVARYIDQHHLYRGTRGN